MHYVAAISDFVLHRSHAPRPLVARTEELPPLKFAGAWRNWWTMTVEEPPPFAARQTRIVDARGRMVPRR